LTLVKRLVEMHGGTVQAESDGAGRGAKFVVRLPLAEGTPLESPVMAPVDLHVLGPRRVLVVDDNHDAADSLAMLLRLLGAEVRIVYGGLEALAALDEFRPSVVLLDIGMPDMDGHEVARRIRRRPEHAGVRLIAMTGWGQESDRRRSTEAGFDFHLIKPADMGALESLLISSDRSPPPASARLN